MITPRDLCLLESIPRRARRRQSLRPRQIDQIQRGPARRLCSARIRTNYMPAHNTPVAAFLPTMDSRNTLWLRLDCSFMCVRATERLRAAFSSNA